MSMMPMQKVEILRAACCVAGIEDGINEKEKTLLDKFASEVGVGKASLTAMIERATNDPDFHKQQFRILKENPQQCLATVIQVAMSDGSVSDSESQVLKSLSQNLGVPDDVFDQLLANVGKML